MPESREQTPEPDQGDIPDPSFLSKSDRENEFLDELTAIREQLQGHPEDAALQQKLREKESELQQWLAQEDTFEQETNRTLLEAEKSVTMAEEMTYPGKEVVNPVTEKEALEPFRTYGLEVEKKKFGGRKKKRAQSPLTPSSEQAERPEAGADNFRNGYRRLRSLERTTLMLVVRLAKPKLSEMHAKVDSIIEPLREKLYRALPADTTLDEIVEGTRVPNLTEAKWAQHAQKVDEAFEALNKVYMEVSEYLSSER